METSGDAILTVVVPTFGRPEALRRCLDGLAVQAAGAGRFEVVVVDDGSPEPLRLDPARWAARFPLRVVRQANAGPGLARNRGVAEAHGALLAFTDDDCIPDPGWIAALRSALREAPDALVGGTTRNGLPASPYSAASQMILDLVYAFYNADAEHPRFFASNNIAVSRAAFLASGGFAATFFRLASEDREFCDRWRMQGRPMRPAPGATLGHFHAQGLGEFVRVHHRYGRGAYHYERIRRLRRSGSFFEDLGFHGQLGSGVRRLLPGRGGVVRRAMLLGLLATWQVVNALGFVREAAATRWSARAAGRAPDPAPPA